MSAEWDGKERRHTVSSDDIAELKTLITSLDTKLTVHITKEEDVWPAIKELVIIWKGSKIILPFVATCLIAGWAVIEWFRDHVK